MSDPSDRLPFTTTTDIRYQAYKTVKPVQIGEPMDVLDLSDQRHGPQQPNAWNATQPTTQLPVPGFR